MIRRTERGFTLVELLVALVVTAIITGGMFAALFLGLRTVDDTNQNIAGSNDTQLIASYLTSDVASAESVSTNGTTSHAAPSTSAGTANSVMAAFWTLNGGTTVTPAATMSEVWDVASTGSDPRTQLTVDMADELLTGTGASGNRVATSASPDSSITHSVILAPALLQSISRRAASTGVTAGAANLTLSQPTGTANGDVLLAQVAVGGGLTTTVTKPSGWALVDSRAAGTWGKSLIYSHTAATGDPLSWTWVFNGAFQSAGGIVGYAGVGSVSAHADDVNPCGGETPALTVNWTDRGTDISHEVAYDISKDGVETVLVRRHCTGLLGTPVDNTTLARSITPGSGASAACQPVACGPLTSPVNVTMTLTEPPELHSTVLRTYQLSGATRSTQ